MAPRKQKRPRKVIDLTEDDSDSPPAKRQTPDPNSNGVGGTLVYASSQPSASNASNGKSAPSLTQFDEPEYLDLTQDAEEPDRELYGAFGKPQLKIFEEAILLTSTVRRENRWHSVLPRACYCR